MFFISANPDSSSAVEHVITNDNANVNGDNYIVTGDSAIITGYSSLETQHCLESNISV